jgi:hypothetical protein
VLVEHDAVVFDRPRREALAAIRDSWWTA